MKFFYIVNGNCVVVVLALLNPNPVRFSGSPSGNLNRYIEDDIFSAISREVIGLVPHATMVWIDTEVTSA
jgi:hypothetical protein